MALHIALEVARDSSRSLTSQIQEFIKTGISEGTLHPGTRLPSSRRLAGDLAVSRSVVVEAYGQLVAEGYLETAHGSGTRVVSHLGRAPAGTALPDEERESRVRWDLRPGGSSPPAFPRREWLRCYQRVLQSAGAAGESSSPPAGETLLRRELSAYLGRVRGVRTSPEQIVVVPGSAQTLRLLCAALPRLGIDTIAVEDPGHPGQRRLLREGGLRAVTVPADGNGLDVEALAASGARAVLVTPTHQFPLGVTLSDARREALVRWARDVDGWVIEDDHDGGLWYERGSRPLALQRQLPGQVVYAGSASKSLSPGLRLGWLTAPEPMRAHLLNAHMRHDLGTEVFSQLAFGELLRTGLFDRHLRRLNTLGRDRRDALEQAVRRHLPGAEVLGAAAGLHAYVRLPRQTDEAALVAGALRRSVLVCGAAAFHARTHGRVPGLVVGHAHLPRSAVEEAVGALATAGRMW